MVDFLSRSECALLLAAFAQWVGSDIKVTYFLPSAAIAFLGGRIALVAVIPLYFLLGMFLTKPVVGQSWTAGVGARALWFTRHDTASLGKSKGAGLLPLL